MKKFKRTKKALALLLSLSLITGMIPGTAWSAFAAEENALAVELKEELAEAKAYTDGITINNSSNDPAKVVKNFGTHFTWDNEKRESSKSYLFDWSYYNGVVFEGLEYLYETTGEKAYKDYVVEYMESLIASDGTWAKCSNNSGKECAGYNATHGADCYKTASLLLDAYEMTGDSRYMTMAAKLNADLDTAAANSTYSLKNAGKNFRHTWASNPDPDLWLDGLYMILPFRAEYAKHMNNTEELDLIVDRMQWVSDNMYNESKGLFYHAADSATSNSGSYWLRAIGWYAAAIVDIMDSMEGENLEAMKAQLVKLVDGMKACQNTSNGMWLNNMAASQSSTNPYETSGTALTCYAVMKAVNEGWLDESYADMAILAFEGICDEKLDGEKVNLTDICFKGAPGSGNSTFYDNEGKGVGPFIMFYAEMLEYVNNQQVEEPETPVVPEVPEVTVGDTTIKVENVKNLTGAAVEEADKAVIEEKAYTNYVAFDITATIEEGKNAVVSIPVPAEWNATEDELVGISVEDGSVVEIPGTLSADGIYSFEVDHFSAKGVAYNAKAVVETPKYTGEGNLVGEKVYTLDTNGVTANKDYLIVNSSSNGTRYALTNNNGSAGRTAVTVSNNIITVEDDANIAWQFSDDESGTVGNNGRYVYPTRYSLTLDTDDTNMTISNQGNGAYKLYRTEGYYYYLRYNSGSWTGGRTNSTNNIVNVYLYEATYTNGNAVTFAVTPPSEVELKTNNKHSIDATVTVAGKEVDLENCTIAWSSSNSSVATVNNQGVVTGVEDGTTYIHATLSAVNGVDLQENIALVIPVTVQSKTVVEGSAVLTGNTPVTTKKNVEPDFSKIKLEVTYDDDTTGTITVENGLVIEGYDITQIGYTYAKISYKGVEYGEVRVTVEGNPYEGLEEATLYPEYPADGAVRIDKTATHSADAFKDTGVTHVELDVAGISVKRGVDVVLVADISNSMAWKAGAKNVSPGNGETTKWQDLQTAAKVFVNKLLEDNETALEKNTVSFVTFGGYDAERNKNASSYSSYFDATQTVFTSETEIKTAESGIDALSITGNDTDGYTVTKNKVNVGTPQGGTNYDYAFLETASAIDKIKADYATKNNGESYDDSGREIYVVFMTDGAPDHYNQLYYKTRSNTQFDYYALYKNSSDKLAQEYFDIHSLPNYTTFNQRQDPNGYYIPSSNLSNENWIDWLGDKDNPNPLYAAEYVAGIDNVNSISVVGFDLANGAFGNFSFGEAILEPVLENLAGKNSCDVFLTGDSDALNKFYENLATQIKFAGTSAQVTDIIDSDFTLQMANYSGSGDKTATLINPPSIAVTAYDLYTKADGVGNDLLGTRKPGKDYVDVMEYVQFNVDGTEAYSDQIGEGKTDIMSTAADGTVTIEAFYFTYIKTPEGVETFKWKIGNITDKEIVLGFDVYLKGALEGEAPQGTYYTNEEATLEYIDINGKYAKQIFDVPHVNWDGASTTIRFYLVNEKGEPVNHNGDVIPWANRIYVGDPVNINLNLNADMTIPAQTIEAAAHVPGDYFLYDHNAQYTVHTASGEIVTGGIAIAEPSEDAFKKTYDENGNAVIQTGAQTTKLIDAEGTFYTWSVVGFGVRYDLSKEEITPLNQDRIVIDYGKDVQVDVLANDKTVIPTGWKAELIGFVKYNANTDVKYIQANKGSETYNNALEYGAFSIKDGKVNYKPTKMLSDVQKVFCVIKLTELNADGTESANFHYRYNVLNIIPATIMYYETDFADGVFTNVTTGEAWDTQNEGPAADGPQNDGTIGVDQTYGYDSTYNNDSKLSNGSSLFVEGQGVKLNDAATKYTYSQFEFTGTGFDLISRTGAAQGAIRVDIYSDKARKNREKTVTVLNKSESGLELYQIPVVSVNDLKYGTYYVSVGVNAAYTNTSYPQLNRGGEFYFDAIRVYEPAKGNADAEVAYKADNEYGAELFEVRQQLLTAENYGSTSENTTNGVTFVDNIHSGELVDEKPVDGEYGSVGIGKYESIGPNNEVYLASGQGISFAVDYDGTIPTSIDIGAKTITGGEAHMKAYVSTSETQPGTAIVDKDITSSTAQFQQLVNKDNEDTFENKGIAYVFVVNTAGDVLSITDIKVAYGESPVGEISFLSNARTLAFARACVAAPTTPEEPETPVVPDTPVVPEEPDTPVVPDTPVTPEEPENPTVPDKPEADEPEADKPVVDEPKPEKPAADPAKIVSVKTDKKTYTQGDSVKVTVTTNDKATKVKVGTKTLKTFKTIKGKKTWTTTVKASKIGKLSISAVAYNKKGTATKKVTKTVTVKKFAPKKFNVTLSKSKVKKGAKYTVTVKTSTDVKYVKVNGKKITKYTTDKKKTTKTFKITYKAAKTGKKTVKVVSYNKAGYASKAKSKTVTVKR